MEFNAAQLFAKNCHVYDVYCPTNGPQKQQRWRTRGKTATNGTPELTTMTPGEWRLTWQNFSAMPQNVYQSIPLAVATAA